MSLFRVRLDYLVRSAGIAAVVILVCTSCIWDNGSGNSGPAPGSPENPIFADLTGATALGVRSARGPESMMHDSLYQLDAFGDWSIVEFYTLLGDRFDIPRDLVRVLELNASTYILLYGDEEFAPGQVTDIFMLDAESEHMYYLNQVANYSLEFFAASDHDFSVASDAIGNVYYSADPFSTPNLTFGDHVTRRDHPGIVKITPATNDASVTGTYITPDSTSVLQFGVDAAGNIIYAGGDSPGNISYFAFITADGDTDFLESYLPGETDIRRAFSGPDGDIWVGGRHLGVDALWTVDLGSGAPVLSQLSAELPYDGIHDYQQVTKVGANIYVRHYRDLSRVDASGQTRIVSVEGSDNPSFEDPYIIKPDRYMFTLRRDESGDSLALVDFDLESYTIYPLDFSRYSVDSLTEYATDPEKVVAVLTDRLLGTRQTWTLAVDGTVELLNESDEEPIIVTIYPL